LEISTSKNDFASVLKQIEKLQYKIVDYELVKIAKDQVVLNDSDLEKIESLVSNLEDHDDVDSVWSNVKGI
jgi:transcriptional/translational regulatory protein YebC/TACO1